MRLFRQLGRFSLAALSVGLVEPAPSLALQLENQAGIIRAHCCGFHYPPGQKLADDIRAMMNLVVSNLSKFSDEYEACEPVLGSLLDEFILSFPGRYATTDYTCRYQDLSFLDNLCRAYQQALLHMNHIVEWWRETGSDSFDALAIFINDDIEAIRMRCEVEVYHHHILSSSPEVFLGGRTGAIGSVWRAIGGTAKSVENFRRVVCADYETLVGGMVDLFSRMIEELVDILRGFEGAHRVGAYKRLRWWLSSNFEGLFFAYPDDLEQKVASFKTGAGKEPSEVLALAQVRIFGELLKLKLEFPEMDHNDSPVSRFFSLNGAYSVAGSGPPLIGREIMRDFGHLKGSEFLSKFRDGIEFLRMWVHSHYNELQLGDDCWVTDEQAKTWLSEVEEDLGFILEIIGKSEGKEGLYALAESFEHWDSIAVTVERILVILYGRGNLNRGKGQPGYFLTKLREVIRRMLGEGPGLKNACSTQGPEKCMGEGQQVSSCCQREDNRIQRTSDATQIRGCRYTAIVLCVAVMAALIAQCV